MSGNPSGASRRVTETQVNESMLHADECLLAETEQLRSSNARSNFLSIGIPRLARLQFRPQPALSTLPDWRAMFDELPNSGNDWSMAWLMNDMHNVLELENYRPLLSADMNPLHGGRAIHFLSFLDAYAGIDPASRTGNMIRRVAAIYQMLDHLHGFTDSLFPTTELTWPIRMKRCHVYLLLTRLTFYKGRSRGISTNDILASFVKLDLDFGIPDNWSLDQELSELDAEVRTEARALQATFSGDAKLKWDGEPIPVGQISTTIAAKDLVDVHCAICLDTPTPPAVLTIPCKHTYCESCLKPWVHGCTKTSHTCPLCRTELFPKPQYVLDESAEDEERTRFRELCFDLKKVKAARFSQLWLREELTLQDDWEEWAWEEYLKATPQA